MRTAHFDWSRRTLDLGLLPEQMMRDRAAGSSEYEMARRGEETFPHGRILATAVLSGQGPQAAPELLRRMADEDAAVRFWAVIGLTNAAARDAPSVDALQKALDDPAVEVRIVAAEALCRIDRDELALPVLVQALSHQSRWVGLQAANVLDRIGDKARPAVGAMKKAVQDPSQENLFIRWVLDHTLRQLGA
jgi:HEAT repeat protein